MGMKRQRNNICAWWAVAMGGCVLQSCVDNFLPESLDSFDKDAAFTQTMYRPVLGRDNVASDNFSAGNPLSLLHLRFPGWYATMVARLRN